MTDTPVFALLHGGGQGSWAWEQIAAALQERGATVLLLDVPGCGAKRDRDIGTLTVDDIAAELIGDIRSAGFSEVLLVGHSLAGAVLPRMAEQAPELFRRLVYLSCSAPKPGQTFLAMLGTGVHGENEDEVGWPVDPRTHSRAQRDRVMLCNDMDSAQADAFLTRLGQDDWPMDAVTRDDWRYDHLADMPSTYIVCEQDQILPPQWQERFAERLHVDRLVRIDAGHQAMNTRPAELADLLLAEARQ